MLLLVFFGGYVCLCLCWSMCIAKFNCISGPTPVFAFVYLWLCNAVPKKFYCSHLLIDWLKSFVCFLWPCTCVCFCLSVIVCLMQFLVFLFLTCWLIDWRVHQAADSSSHWKLLDFPSQAIVFFLSWCCSSQAIFFFSSIDIHRNCSIEFTTRSSDIFFIWVNQILTHREYL